MHRSLAPLTNIYVQIFHCGCHVSRCRMECTFGGQQRLRGSGVDAVDHCIILNYRAQQAAASSILAFIAHQGRNVRQSTAQYGTVHTSISSNDSTRLSSVTLITHTNLTSHIFLTSWALLWLLSLQLAAELQGCSIAARRQHDLFYICCIVITSTRAQRRRTKQRYPRTCDSSKCRPAPSSWQ